MNNLKTGDLIKARLLKPYNLSHSALGVVMYHPHKNILKIFCVKVQGSFSKFWKGRIYCFNTNDLSWEFKKLSS